MVGKGALGAVILTGLTPRRVALAHQDTPLWRAYLIHWACLIIGALALIVIVAFDDPSLRDLGELWELVVGVVFSPDDAAVCAIIVLVIEAAFGLLAFLLVPWGCAQVPVGHLWRQALRSVWLHTGHLVLAGVAYGSLLVLGDNVLQPERWLDYRLADPPPARMVPVLLKWLYDNYEYLLAIAFAAAAIWYLWALLRAMTTQPPHVATSRPPLCEVCGYNLSHHDMSARCPECGRPVVLSLGDDVRSVVPWGPYGSRARRTSFWKVTLDAWLNPERFFMGVAVFAGRGSAGRFLLNQMLLTAVAFVAALAGGMALLFGGFRMEGFVFTCSCIGAVLGFIVGCLASSVAGVVGLIVSRQDGRNCLAGALRVACFCAGIFPPWVFSQFTALLVVLKILESPGRVPPPVFMIIPIAFLALIAVLLVIYIGGVARRTRYVRYANT
ncbi:MAG: hypothetical protein ACYSUI_00710 [Planctomycetota bacterium]|jgi:hypothetical protein